MKHKMLFCLLFVITLTDVHSQNELTKENYRTIEFLLDNKVITNIYYEGLLVCIDDNIWNYYDIEQKERFAAFVARFIKLQNDSYGRYYRKTQLYGGYIEINNTDCNKILAYWTSTFGLCIYGYDWFGNLSYEEFWLRGKDGILRYVGKDDDPKSLEEEIINYLKK